MSIRVISQEEILRTRYKKIKVDKKFLFIGLLAIILSFFIDIKRFLFIGIMIVANCIVLSLDRYVSMPIDIELSSFTAILCSTAFGLKWGLFAGFITKFAAMMYNATIRLDHFFMMGGYCLSAFIANLLTGWSIFTVGIISVFIVNVYIWFVSKYVTGLTDFEIFMYGSSNFIFNFVLFIAFAEPVLSVLRM